MSNHERVYSEKEFALVLRKASELASRVEQSPSASSGLTLAEMKAAAAQAGFDPADIERAARMLGGRESPLERIAGGPIRHGEGAHFAVDLDEESAARLLSAIRVAAGVAGNRDVAHAGPMGMTWHDGGDLESLAVTARQVEGATVASVTLDRRRTLGIVGLGSGLGVFFTLLFSGSVLYPEAAALGYAGAVTGIGAVLAGARTYWASSTRRARERIAQVMHAVAQALDRADRAPLAETGEPPSIRPPSDEVTAPDTR